jgi:hypothetical protein
VHFAKSASLALLSASAAAAASAQCFAAPCATRLLVGQDKDAKDGVAANTMPAPTVIKKQDLKDIQTSHNFSRKTPITAQ